MLFLSYGSTARWSSESKKATYLGYVAPGINGMYKLRSCRWLSDSVDLCVRQVGYGCLVFSYQVKRHAGNQVNINPKVIRL